MYPVGGRIKDDLRIPSREIHIHIGFQFLRFLIGTKSYLYGVKIRIGIHFLIQVQKFGDPWRLFNIDPALLGKAKRGVKGQKYGQY